jgi:hypothetical protein
MSVGASRCLARVVVCSPVDGVLLRLLRSSSDVETAGSPPLPKPPGSRAGGVLRFVQPDNAPTASRALAVPCRAAARAWRRWLAVSGRAGSRRTAGGAGVHMRANAGGRFPPCSVLCLFAQTEARHPGVATAGSTVCALLDGIDRVDGACPVGGLASIAAVSYGGTPARQACTSVQLPSTAHSPQHTQAPPPPNSTRPLANSQSATRPGIQQTSSPANAPRGVAADLPTATDLSNTLDRRD